MPRNRPHRQTPPAYGFTLLELVLVIVLLACLAVVALSRFVDLKQDANVAAVKSLAGALAQAATQVRMTCAAKSPQGQCDPSSSFQHVALNGHWYWLNYGYPDAGDDVDNDEIDSALLHNGFSVVLTNNLTSTFTKDGAPTPAGCSVQYLQASSTAGPTITTTTTGC